jgi:hypothetical protein
LILDKIKYVVTGVTVTNIAQSMHEMLGRADVGEHVGIRTACA